MVVGAVTGGESAKAESSTEQKGKEEAVDGMGSLKSDVVSCDSLLGAVVDPRVATDE